VDIPVGSLKQWGCRIPALSTACSRAEVEQNLKAAAVLLDSERGTAVACPAKFSGAVNKAITSFDPAGGRTATVGEPPVLISREGKQSRELPSCGYPKNRATLTGTYRFVLNVVP
jgi:hypothetical protein